MTDDPRPAASRTPPVLPHHRDPGDAWVEAPDGARYWGRFGAAGLLVHDPARGVLLQHRALWSHHGGTWGIPGGALHQNEQPLVGAVREAHEEAGVPLDAVTVTATTVLDHGVWSYTTAVAGATRPFEPQITDAESLEVSWVAVDEVDRLPLHPAFAQAWPLLQTMLPRRPVVVVDAANVIGSVPDGWWRDRPGAASRLLERLASLADVGIDAPALELPGTRWFPRVEAVLEGEAKAASAPPGVSVHLAPSSGDDTIAARSDALAGERLDLTVVTSDRGLAARLPTTARVVGAQWLLALLDSA